MNDETDVDDPEPQPRPRWRRRFAISAQLLVGLGLGLGLAEFAFRARDDGAFPHVNFYLPDHDLGVRLEPGASMRFQLRQNPVSTIHVNSRGYRGDEWPAPGTREVLVVGDSQVFGLGVDDDATFSARLAALSGRPVINAGVPTYGPREYITVAQELLGERKVGSVVVALNFVNDPFELERPNKDRHKVWDGWAVRRETAPRSVTSFPGRRWLFSRSHAMYALRRWLHERGSARAPEAADIDPGTPSEGELQDLLATRNLAHEGVAPAEAAPTLAEAAARVRAIDDELVAKRDALDALVDDTFGQANARIARALPGDIVEESSAESSRSTVATASMIRAASRDRANHLAKILQRESKAAARPAHDLIAAHGNLTAERKRLREQIATGVAPVARPPSQFREYLREFKALCDSFGAELVVVALPIDVQVDPHEWQKYGVVDGPDMRESLVLLDDLLADARDLGLRTLDATPALRAAQPGAFLDHDIHMTAKGHAALAEALAAALVAPIEPPPGPVRGLPEGRSFAPSHAEWSFVAALEIAGLRELGCAAQLEREWLRVHCRRRGWLERFDAVEVRAGATPATMAMRTDDALHVVTPLTLGEPLQIRLRWKGKTRDLAVVWSARPDGTTFATGTVTTPPAAPGEPTRPPADPLAPAISRLCACPGARPEIRLCADVAPPALIRCDAVCTELWGDPRLAPACLAAFTDCADQLACVANDPLFAPPCPEGQVHAFASNACFAACGPEQPCAAGTCTPWLTGSVCVT